MHWPFGLVSLSENNDDDVDIFKFCSVCVRSGTWARLMPLFAALAWFAFIIFAFPALWMTHCFRTRCVRRTRLFAPSIYLFCLCFYFYFSNRDQKRCSGFSHLSLSSSIHALRQSVSMVKRLFCQWNTPHRLMFKLLLPLRFHFSLIYFQMYWSICVCCMCPFGFSVRRFIRALCFRIEHWTQLSIA